MVREDVDFKVEPGSALKRKSAATQLKEDFKTLKENRVQQSTNKIFNIGQSVEQCIKFSNPLAYKAYKLLDEAIMNKLKYNIKKVTAEVIIKENNLVEVKLLKLLNNTFRINLFYTIDEIKSKIQQIYNDLNIRDANRKIRVATANQLDDNVWFQTYQTKRKNKKGDGE